MEPTFEPARTMALLWALFGATHIGLATRRPRAALVRRFGEWGFALAFSLVAAVAFATLVTWYALHRGEGAAWPGLATVPWVRAVAIGAIVVGASLIGGALVVYSGSPMSLQHEDVKPPMGLARITRHGFFVGLSLFAFAHVLLASRAVGAVFFAGFALVSIAGAVHQDRKLLARKGKAYADYLAESSGLPFAAVLAGRQYVVWRELPWLGLVAGAGIAVLLRSIHGSILADGGVWFSAVILSGAGLELLHGWRRERRSRLQTVPDPVEREAGARV